MTTPLLRTVAGLALALFILAPAALHAAWPAVIMIYGGPLQRAVFVGPKVVAGPVDYRFLFGRSPDRLSKDLTNRPYFSLAMFWGGELWEKAQANPAVMTDLGPESANQHGRLYPPVGSEPAVVIATPFMAGSPCARDVDGQPVAGFGHPRFIPKDVNGFPCGWILRADELKALQELGVPGF